MAATPPRLEVREQADSRGRATIYASATLGEGNTIGNATETKTEFGEKLLNAKHSVEKSSLSTREARATELGDLRQATHHGQPSVRRSPHNGSCLSQVFWEKGYVASQGVDPKFV